MKYQIKYNRVTTWYSIHCVDIQTKLLIAKTKAELLEIVRIHFSNKEIIF